MFCLENIVRFKTYFTVEKMTQYMLTKALTLWSLNPSELCCSKSKSIGKNEEGYVSKRVKNKNDIGIFKFVYEIPFKIKIEVLIILLCFSVCVVLLWINIIQTKLTILRNGNFKLIESYPMQLSETLYLDN